MISELRAVLWSQVWSPMPLTRERRGWLPAGACKPVLGRGRTQSRKMFFVYPLPLRRGATLPRAAASPPSELSELAVKSRYQLPQVSCCLFVVFEISLMYHTMILFREIYQVVGLSSQIPPRFKRGDVMDGEARDDLAALIKCYDIQSIRPTDSPSASRPPLSGVIKAVNVQPAPAVTPPIIAGARSSDGDFFPAPRTTCVYHALLLADTNAGAAGSHRKCSAAVSHIVPVYVYISQNNIKCNIKLSPSFINCHQLFGVACSGELGGIRTSSPCLPRAPLPSLRMRARR